MTAAIARKLPEKLAGLSDDEFEQVLALAGGGDSVELTPTAPDEHHRSTIVALGMVPLDAQIRMVSFFDTLDLALNNHGPVARLRRVQGREDDSVDLSSEQQTMTVAALGYSVAHLQAGAR